jgi:dienelactone hydrolase
MECVVALPEQRGGSSHSVDLDGMAIPRSRPFYFGPGDRPLFGTLHVPPDGWSGARVLVCAPLGYEAHFAQITLGDLAASIASARKAVAMTFDYDGTGDSTGADDEPGFVGRALASIHHAIDYLKALPGTPGPVLVVGLRIGAVLAAYAASTRADVHALALWAPLGGRAFLREHRVFSQLSDSNPPAPPAYAPDFGARGFESNGCIFDDGAVGELEKMDLKHLAKAPAPHVLVLHRAELPSWRKAPDGWSGAAVEEQTAGGYSEMMEPPWIWTSPREAIHKLLDWVALHGGAPATPRAPLMIAPNDRAAMPGGIEERAVWFGPDKRRFGILTTPIGRTPTRAALFVSSVFSYRIGPNRSNVHLARRLAAAGIACLRIDVTGVGDSRERAWVTPTHPYDEVAVDDALQAIEYLHDEKFSSISAVGICAGAFVCWRAAERSPRAINAVLVNIALFDPRDWTREQHLQWRAAVPAHPPKLDPNAPLRVKVRARLKQVARVLKNRGPAIALASLPTFLNRAGLPARIAKLGRRGSRLVLVYSATDAALRHYRASTSYHQLRFASNETAVTRVVHGPDHSFTPRWAQVMLAEVVVPQITGWTR